MHNRAMTSSEPVYGVDLVTFYHPGFWGLPADAASDAELAAHCAQDVTATWTRMLDALAQAGVTGVEVTFPPLDHASAVAAFGSAEGARDAFAARDLRIVSGFVNGTHWDTLTPEQAVAEVRTYTEFLATVGGDVLVVGSPMEIPDGTPAPTAAVRVERIEKFTAATVAVAEAAAAQGIRVAIHTESHSVTVQADDVRTVLARADELSPEGVVVGLCPDSAHLTLSGVDPVALAEEFADRVFVSHWKDATGPFPADRTVAPGQSIHHLHREYMASLGDGVVDWAGWARVMATTPTAGLRLLELDAAADPVTELRAARRVATQW
jgi:sugar phosphate isomerase/epimerase